LCLQLLNLGGGKLFISVLVFYRLCVRFLGM
jgi:hypothetical protein